MERITMMLRDRITVKQYTSNSITGKKELLRTDVFPARVEWSGKLYSDDNGQQVVSNGFILTGPINLSVNDFVTKVEMVDGTVYNKKYPIKQVKPCGSYKIEHLEVLI